MNTTSIRTLVPTAALTLVLGAFLVCLASNVHAQAAGAGAKFNNAERTHLQEVKRLERVDPPIKPDPVGNALIGGAVTGSMKGAAAGAASALRGAAVGTTVQEVKQSVAERKAENQRTGRGSVSDPRFDPRSLFNR